MITKYGIYANTFAEKKNVKSYSHFFSKNTCELDIVLTRTVNILTTNKLVKLRMLWTTGLWHLVLTNLFWEDSSTTTFCTSLFPIAGCLVSFYYYYVL